MNNFTFIFFKKLSYSVNYLNYDDECELNELMCDPVQLLICDGGLNKCKCQTGYLSFNSTCCKKN